MSHGSVQNMMNAQSVNDTKPEVGMGVTVISWSDRDAGTITRVSNSGKTFWYTEDTAKRIDKNGLSECQEYEYTSNLDGKETEVRLRKDGRWRTIGGGRYVNLGYRQSYRDPSF